MNYDVLEQISQGGRTPQDTEIIRIAAIVDELQRVCRVHAPQSRTGKENDFALEVEQRAAEKWAKENRCWLPISDVLELGYPGPSGNENDTYVDEKENVVYKVNNLFNSGSIIAHLKKIIIHNTLFPETAYTFHCFAGMEGRSVLPVFKQKWVSNARPATQIMIDTYLTAIGFEKTDTEGSFRNATFEAWDLVPRNVLVDNDGDIYIVDAEIKQIQ